MKFKTLCGFIFAAILFPSLCVKAVEPTPYNADWSYDAEHQLIGFWLSQAKEHGSCPESRAERPMLWVFSRTDHRIRGDSADNIQIKDGWFCELRWDEDKYAHCINGTLSFHYDQETDDYIGHYEIEVVSQDSLFGLRPGLWPKIFKGDFRAQYCPPSIKATTTNK